ncbi:GGDEF domain-containing protein [Stenotrophomonas sp. P5_B8]
MRCREALRDRDLFARFGGAQFIALLSAPVINEVPVAVERLRSAIAADPITVGGTRIAVSISVGAAIGEALPGGDQPLLEELVARADEARYQATTEGRNRVRMADPVRRKRWMPAPVACPGTAATLRPSGPHLEGRNRDVVCPLVRRLCLAAALFTSSALACAADAPTAETPLQLQQRRLDALRLMADASSPSNMPDREALVKGMIVVMAVADPALLPDGWTGIAAQGIRPSPRTTPSAHPQLERRQPFPQTKSPGLGRGFLLHLRSRSMRCPRPCTGKLR